MPGRALVLDHERGFRERLDAHVLDARKRAPFPGAKEDVFPVSPSRDPERSLKAANRADSPSPHERFALFERDMVFFHSGSPRGKMVARPAEKKKFQKG